MYTGFVIIAYTRAFITESDSIDEYDRASLAQALTSALDSLVTLLRREREHEITRERKRNANRASESLSGGGHEDDSYDDNDGDSDSDSDDSDDDSERGSGADSNDDSAGGSNGDGDGGGSNARSENRYGGDSGHERGGDGGDINSVLPYVASLAFILLSRLSQSSQTSDSLSSLALTLLSSAPSSPHVLSVTYMYALACARSVPSSSLSLPPSIYFSLIRNLSSSIGSVRAYSVELLSVCVCMGEPRDASDAFVRRRSREDVEGGASSGRVNLEASSNGESSGGAGVSARERHEESDVDSFFSLVRRMYPHSREYANSHLTCSALAAYDGPTSPSPVFDVRINVVAVSQIEMMYEVCASACVCIPCARVYIRIQEQSSLHFCPYNHHSHPHAMVFYLSFSPSLSLWCSFIIP